MQNGYIKSLDGVRALAIILVMTFHAGLNHFGWMGVQLFFVLSGYLITGILWKEKFKDGRLPFKFKKFWARRSLRIFPLYFGYLIILGITYLVFYFPVYYPFYAPYLFTYTVNYTRLLPGWQGNPLFTHLWSLSIEEQFYIFFPFLIFLLQARWIKYLMLAVIALGPVIRFLLAEHYLTNGHPLPIAADAVYWHTLSHLDAFFIGGAIPVFALDKKIRHPRIILLVCLCIAVIAGIYNYMHSASPASFFADLGYNHDEPGNYAHVWRYTCLNLLFASFILTLTTMERNERSWMRSFFESSIMTRIGKVSYGMYIFHWLIFVYVYTRFFTAETFVMRLLVFIPYLITVYLVAALSFTFYESYFIKLKDRLFRNRAARDAEVMKAGGL